MSDSELKKRLERLRGTPIPSPKIDKKIEKREELKEIRFVQAPPPTEIKTIGEVKKAESYLKGASDEAKRTLDCQLKSIALQQQAIKDAEVSHKAIVRERSGKKLTKESQKAYKKYLDEYVEYLKNAKSNVSLSEENVEKINQAIKELEKQKQTVTKFRIKKGEVIAEPTQYKVTYTKDGKSKTETFDTIEKAKKFAESVSIPKRGPIQDLMRSRIIKQTDLVDGKIYYTLDKPVEKLTPGQRRLLEQAGFDLPLPGKTDAERYKNQVESTSSWLANLIHADLIDKKQAEKDIKELEPVYLSTIKYGPEQIGELIKKVDIKQAELEKKAKYEEYGKGYTLFGLEPLPPEVVKTRVAHLALSATVGATKSAPFIALGTVGGPVVSGLIGASMIATIANPKNQALLKQYVKEHPQQFIAELSGALALGYTVSQVKSLYNKYKHDIPDLYTQQFELQLATDVPDFPSVRTEELHPWFEETVYTKFLKGLSAEDAQKFLKSGEATLYFGAGDEFGRPMSIYDLMEVHPKLDEPMAIYLPNVKRLVPKYADLITNVPGEKGMYVMPSVVAAMSIIAQQGYITDEDIQKLIKSIENQNLNINVEEIQIPWSDEFLETITVPDVIAIVDSIPITVTTPIIEPITSPTLEPVLDVPSVSIPEQPQEVMPPEEPLPSFRLPKDEKRMHQFRIQLFRGPKSKYRVDFHYPRKAKQFVTVEARSYPEALSKAQRIRRITHELPNMVDMRRVK